MDTSFPLEMSHDVNNLLFYLKVRHGNDNNEAGYL